MGSVLVPGREQGGAAEVGGSTAPPRVLRRRVSLLLSATAMLSPWMVLGLGALHRVAAELLGFGLLLVLSQVSLLVAGLGLLANGVVVVRREGPRVATVIAPLAGLGLLVLSMAIRDVVEPGSGTPAWLSVTAGMIVVLGAFLVAQLLAFTGYALAYSRLPRPTGSDVIVVLGCGLDGEQVTPLLATRLDRAVQVYRAETAAGATPIVVASGGRGPGETVAEADAMAAYLVAEGVPEKRIIRERRSRNTEENLRCTDAELRGRGLRARAGRMVVVTSDFHVLRAVILSRRLGLGARVVGGRTARYFVLTGFLREFVALLALKPRTNITVALLLIAPAVVGYFTLLIR
ncbi:YdcF family protein [Nocardia sp. alder85J]|uniref:YdcF family protein n=1 Tax=Nocardia sp. alder85J TaxID=2862949 RepID=UPI0022564B34|nr:YdcF family protein [Nocardia sp. alder85J]MCX4090786.1 YdcF family protein [Nocardia sp. alder85J]